MANYNTTHYKLNYSRYQHYYRQIWRFYQKPSAKVSTALLLTLFTTIFFAVFAIRPTLVTIAELLKTIQDRQEVLAKLEDKSASLAAAQQEYLIASDQISLLDDALPSDLAVQELITQIEATAAHHQLALSSINVAEFEYSTDATNNSEELLELPLTVTLSGDYLKLEQFISNILNLPRFTRLESLSISAVDSNENSVSSESSLEVNLRLTAFYQPEEITIE